MAREAKKCRFPFESVMDGDRLVIKKKEFGQGPRGDSQICECTFTPFLIIVPEGSPYICLCLCVWMSDHEGFVLFRGSTNRRTVFGAAKKTGLFSENSPHLSSVFLSPPPITDGADWQGGDFHPPPPLLSSSHQPARSGNPSTPTLHLEKGNSHN